MIDHILNYLGSLGIFLAIAISFGVLALVGLLARRKPQPIADPPEPIQKYDRFPEPTPMRTIEVREGPDVPWDDLPR